MSWEFLYSGFLVGLSKALMLATVAWAWLRFLDNSAGVDFKTVYENICRDPRAAADYLRGRFVPTLVCFTVVIVF